MSLSFHTMADMLNEGESVQSSFSSRADVPACYWTWFDVQ